MKQVDFSNRRTPPIWAKGTGTVYTLTATAAAVAFGTKSPAIVLPEKGKWLISGYAVLRYEGATFASARTTTLKLRRTNNTAADIGEDGSRTLLTGVVTTLTDIAGQIIIPPTVYETANTDDAITLFGDVSVLPSAGTFTIVEAYIRAERYDD